MTRKAVAFSSLLTLFLLFFGGLCGLLVEAPESCSAGYYVTQSALVGVAADDWFKYDSVASWNSTDPQATPPQEALDLQNIEYWLIEVTNVSGTEVWYRFVNHPKNGTEVVGNHNIDLDMMVAPSPLPFLVPASLSEGDRVYRYSEEWTISETETKQFLDGPREVNHLNVSETSPQHNITRDFRWDRATGVMIEYTVVYRYFSGEHTEKIEHRITIMNCNVWVVPEFQSAIVLLLLLLLSTVISVLGKKLG